MLTKFGKVLTFAEGPVLYVCMYVCTYVCVYIPRDSFQRSLAYKIQVYINCPLSYNMRTHLHLQCQDLK